MTRSLGATTPHHQSKCTEKIFQLSPAYKSKSWAPFSFRDKGKPRKVSSSIAMYQIPTRQPLFRPQKVSYFIKQNKSRTRAKRKFLEPLRDSNADIWQCWESNPGRNGFVARSSDDQNSSR